MLACGVMSGSGRASLAHLRRLLAVPLALAAAVADRRLRRRRPSATAKATAARLVSQAFSASGAIDSGRVELTLDAARSNGVKQLGGKPVTLDAQRAVPARRLRAALGRPERRRSIAAGDTANIGLVLVPRPRPTSASAAPSTTLPRAARRPARTAPAAPSGASGGILGALGIDPHGWLTRPRTTSAPPTVGGVRPSTSARTIDVAKLLGDRSTALARTGATARAGASGARA